MSKAPWIVGGLVVALIGAGTFHALRSPAGPTGLAVANAGVTPTPGDDVRVIVPSGTDFTVVLGTTLSTQTVRAGESFTGSLASAIAVEGDVVIPAGADVSGRVTLAEQPGGDGGRGKIQLLYDQVSFGGHAYDLGTQSEVYRGLAGDSPRARAPELILPRGAVLNATLEQSLSVRRS